MPAAVAQVERRGEVADARKDRAREAHSEPQKCDEAEHDGGAKLQKAELVGTKLQVRAREVACECVGVLARDPDRRARGLKTAAQLLANVRQGAVGDAGRHPRLELRALQVATHRPKTTRATPIAAPPSTSKASRGKLLPGELRTG